MTQGELREVLHCNNASLGTCLGRMRKRGELARDGKCYYLPKLEQVTLAKALTKPKSKVVNRWGLTSYVVIGLILGVISYGVGRGW